MGIIQTWAKVHTNSDTAQTFWLAHLKILPKLILTLVQQQIQLKIIFSGQIPHQPRANLKKILRPSSKFTRKSQSIKKALMKKVFVHILGHYTQKFLIVTFNWKSSFGG